VPELPTVRSHQSRKFRILNAFTDTLELTFSQRCNNPAAEGDSAGDGGAVGGDAGSGGWGATDDAATTAATAGGEDAWGAGDAGGSGW
jgi:hypothetical protein